MADNIYVQQGKFVVDSSLVPYIRKQDIVYEAENLRPGKICRIFFDDAVINHLTQKANEIVLNTKKALTLNVTGTIVSGSVANYTAYQGITLASNTFSSKVDSYDSNNKTIVLTSMRGDFDINSPLYVYDSTTTSVVATNEILTETHLNTSDTFYNGEEILCANSNVYMTVVSSSGEDILYVNENYLTLNISNSTVGLLSTMSGQYSPGDVIYQTVGSVGQNQEFATYVGKVMYFNPNNGGNTISVQTISGVLNANSLVTNSNCRIWNSTKPSSAPIHVYDVKQNNISPNNILKSISTGNTVTVLDYIHSSSFIGKLSASPTIVYVNSSNTAAAVGNLFYITSGTGIGQYRLIDSASGGTLTLHSALTVTPDFTSKYSIGNHIVDEYGSAAGIFNMPEESNFKFKTGERIFTITDTDTVNDADATMKASGRFTASGLINITQKLTTSPVGRPLPEYTADNPVAPVNPTERTFNSVSSQVPVSGSDVSGIPKMPLADGLSQTFFTPKPNSNKSNHGIFVTSVDLFFQSKPSVANGSIQLPVTVKIAEVVNGFPTKNYLASKTLKAKDVRISTNPSTANAEIYAATRTKFTFNDPVYLQPDSEYAIVVSSESPEYELYVAELGGEVLGADPPRRISEQPYAGSLFRSQNATTWTPYQNQDLMFVINKAVFNGTGSVTFNLQDSPLYQMNLDRLILHSNELTFPSSQLNYTFGGIIKATGQLESTSNYHTIIPHKSFNFSDLVDRSNKITSANSYNSRLIQFGNANSVIVRADFTTSDPDVSPIFNKESISLALFENQINNAEMSNNIISITNPGAGYNAVITAAQYTGSIALANTCIKGNPGNDAISNTAQLFRLKYLANNFNVGFYSIAVANGSGSGANGFAVANTTGSNTVDYIVITSGGSGYITTPSVTIAAPNAISSNITAMTVVHGETGKSGGNIWSKYITRQITLEDGFESGDLRVFMDANVPAGTDVVVYYKVLGSEDPEPFSNKSWVLMQKKNNVVSKDTRQLVELEFHPSLLVNKLSYVENGTQYPIGDKFKSFAIKIGLLTSDPAIPPSVKNLRIIATPEG